jgi:ARMET, C-terminal
MQHKYADQGVQFVGLTNEDTVTASNFVKQMGKQMEYRVASDTVGVSQTLSQHYSVSGIPAAFIAGYDGNVVWNGHPMDPGFESTIQKLLREKPKPKPKIVAYTREQLSGMRISQLRTILHKEQLQQSEADCVEKKDFVDKILNFIQEHGIDDDTKESDSDSKTAESSAEPKQPTPEPVTVPVEKNTNTEAELRAMRVKELRAILAQHNVSTIDCVEKSDLVAKIISECQ